ncbi:hypothetical protein XENTR_v10016398 [Xenopus tropicalis]|nr:hypothetical protein XENTR_v10016398 [Xenopus tropicalis]
MDLSESWKQQFFKLFPIIPAVLQLIGAFIIIILGCFGEIHVGTPWWSGILFVVSGASLCLLFKWPLVRLELFAFATVVLSILAAAAAVIVYALEFSVPQLFPHDHSDVSFPVTTSCTCEPKLKLTFYQIKKKLGYPCGEGAWH